MRNFTSRLNARITSFRICSASRGSTSRSARPIQINQILEDTLSLREYDMKLNNIRIHREFDPNLPSVGGDCHQLQQVFLNILNNAVDAVAEKAWQG